MTSKVTIGLCLKNSGKCVETALDSIERQDFPHADLSLIIVDEDEKNSNTIKLLKNYANRTDVKTIVLTVHNIGLGASRQIVVDAAEGDYLVWVDDDFVLKHDFISKHVQFMERNSQIAGALAHELVDRNKKFSVVLYVNYAKILNELNEAGSPMGGFEIFRLSALRQIGGFDTKIKGAAEDRDVSIRLKNAGWRLSNNNSAEYYRKCLPGTWKSLWRKRFWYGYGLHFLFHKYATERYRLELFFPATLWLGFKDSLKIYRVVSEKKVFLLSIYYLYINTAAFFGFFKADKDGYSP
jgi:cellulose synthase/poly-beta-1,6-N-acetylglucosamine synthase-like glycosyltransferase